MTTSMIFAGFGGQGIQFAGKQVAKYALHSNKQVTWLSSYGPEMRGGTSNCSVIISDEEIGCPLITYPDILIALNLPSFDKFEPKITSGGTLFADSTLIEKRSARTDIKCEYIPATKLASENALEGFANVIMLGYFIKKTGLFDYEDFLSYLVSSIPQSKTALIEKNKNALSLGYNYGN